MSTKKVTLREYNSLNPLDFLANFILDLLSDAPPVDDMCRGSRGLERWWENGSRTLLRSC